MTALPEAWHDFYLLAGGASATLAGLMFIAITLYSGAPGTGAAPRDVRGLNTFLSPTLIHFVYVLALASIVLVPTITGTMLGILLILAGLGSLGHVVRTLPFLAEQYRLRRIDRSDLFWYAVMPALVYVMLFDAGGGLLNADLHAARPPYALDVLAAAAVLLLVMGVHNAWDLMVWMILRQAAAQKADLPSAPQAQRAAGAPGGGPPGDRPPADSAAGRHEVRAGDNVIEAQTQASEFSRPLPPAEGPGVSRPSARPR
jgi:hypothetical protein